MDIPQGFELEQPTSQPTQPEPSQQQTPQDNGLPPGFEVEGSDQDAQPQTSTLGAVARGIGRGVLTSPVETAIETNLLHHRKSDIRQSDAEHPIATGIGEGLGLVGSAITGVGEGAMLEHAGQAIEGLTTAGKAAQEATGAAKALGLSGSEAAKTVDLMTQNVPKIAKIGTSAIKQAAEMAIYQSGDEVSKMILNDPDTTAETALSNIGMAAALGAGTGAFVTGALSPLFKSTAGVLGNSLEKLKMNLNGETTSSVMKEAQELGLQLKPEVASAMGDSPLAKATASTLSQSDTTNTGRMYQAAIADFREQANNSVLETAGKTTEDLSNLEVNDHETGKNLAHIMADEYDSKQAPNIRVMEDFKASNKDMPLTPDVITKTPDFSNPYNATYAENKTPGTVTRLNEAIMQHAQSEGFLDPGSDISKIVTNAVTNISKADNLGQLIKIAENTGKNTYSAIPNAVSRAGQIIKGLIEDHIQQFAIENANAKGLTDQVKRLLDAKQAFGQVAKLKDVIDDVLHTGASASGFGKELRSMGSTEGEKVITRLGTNKNAHLLSTIEQNFPETAAKLKSYHIDRLVSSATKDGKFNASKFVDLVNNEKKTSPQLKQFLFKPEQLDRFNRLNDLTGKLADSTHNWSNTARTMDKLTEHLGGGALSAVGMLTGHGLAGGALGLFANSVLRESSDAARLGLLRFLSSEAPVNPTAFKAMTQMISATQKGADAVKKASLSVLKPAAKVITMPPLQLVAQREKLDKQVDKFTKSPEALMASTQGETGHYLPGHQVALTQATTRNIQYLQQLKPQPKQISPLDRPIAPTPQDITRYNRALDIANDPTQVMQSVKDGTVTVNDLKDLQAMWPKYYQLSIQHLANATSNHVADEHPIPYKTRMGLSLYMGQAMDSSMHPQNIQAAQTALMPQSNQSQTQNGKPTKGSASKLGKTNSMYKTATQAAETDRSDRD